LIETVINDLDLSEFFGRGFVIFTKSLQEVTMKYILGALAAVTLMVGVAASQPADAACYWTPYGWHCWHPHHDGYWHHRYWDRPYWG
jgi:hypothetical protein